MRTVFTSVFAALALGAALPAAAATPEGEHFTLQIHYGDLDLSSASDIAVLEARIETSVIEACTMPRRFDEDVLDYACVERTLASARNAVQSLTDLPILASAS